MLRFFLLVTVIVSASYGDPIVSNRRFMRRDDVHQPARPTEPPARPNAPLDDAEAERQAKEFRYNRVKQRLDDTAASFHRFSTIVAMAAEVSEDPSANQLRSGDLPLGHDPVDRIEALERRVQSLEFRGVDLQIISEKLLAEFEKKNRLAMEAIEKESAELRWQEEARQKEEAREHAENVRLREEAEVHRAELRRQYSQHHSGGAVDEGQPAWQLYALYAVVVVGFAGAVWVLWMLAASWCARKPSSKKPSSFAAPNNAAAMPLNQRPAFGTPPPPPAPARAVQQQQPQFINPGFEGELRNRALSRWDQ